MSLDYAKKAYRPDRPYTRLNTTYGGMSEWIRRPVAAAARAHRPGLPAAGLSALYNYPSPQFNGNKGQRGKKEYIYMKRALSAGPTFDARRDALDDTVPIHARYTTDSGYDDFHKAYRAAKATGPREDFPLWGPPRLRQGRQGGSWRHVKEVLQAGGKRIVFVDGQVSIRDTQEIDGVLAGHLILADAKGPHLNSDMDRLLGIPSAPKLFSQTPTSVYHGALTAKQGLEKNNWNIIR